MPRDNFGPAVQNRTRNLLAALLTRVDHNWEDPDTDWEYTWLCDRDLSPKLWIETTLEVLSRLTDKNCPGNGLTTSEVNESLNRLEDLGILVDRISKQGRKKWRFTLELKSKNIHENLAKFDVEWKRRKGSATDTQSANYSIFKEFQALINEKTQEFVGRKYVFDEIEDFLSHQPNGYFTIEADPGIGKSAILAKFAQDKGCIAYFNIRSQGRNRADQFLTSVCSQLCDRYHLPYQPFSPDTHRDGNFLAKLLEEASAKLRGEEKLVIAIDALDEVDLKSQDPGANILYLPAYLPQNVYLILTRRKVTLPFVVHVPQQLFDLMRYSAASRLDIKEYIGQAARRSRLETWIAQRNLTLEAFIEQLAQKSANNFMYLRYVLPQIENGFYQDLKIEQLPKGLENYYEDHWYRMGMRDKPLPQAKIKIVYILAEISQPVSRKLISEYATESELAVQEVLDRWEQFLSEQDIDRQICYSIYHSSFRDFLHRNDIVQAAGVTFPEIYGAIAQHLLKGIEDVLENE
ncbi:ATP-binding protein [Merismopedia glauca]|uniref:ATP-binding protein n=1 Tax=Merismopedia glauca CCAP 1448/3 TaxID=1296344 RepID=A0A2T1C6L2_9CYAN|nr:ATP-binding protein [Merismopedia glauca]PSB03889.1 ATP-binding protein [Merismopedia glauca CCAP 1448/3]